MTKSKNNKNFCNDIRAYLKLYNEVSEERKSLIIKDICYLLAYANGEYSIDPALQMRGKRSDCYRGYFISGEVKKLNETNQPKYLKEGVSDEHIIPKIVVATKMKEIYDENPRNLTDEKILFFSKLLSYSCLVTKEEDSLLRKNGLSEKMPDCWIFNISEEDYADSPDLRKLQFFSRYEKVGIKYFENENMNLNLSSKAIEYKRTYKNFYQY